MCSRIEPYLAEGTRIGDYTVRDIAGSRGGTATVYICETPSGKKVAIKRFHADKVSPKMRERIYEEASLNLGSSYLVTSREVFEEDGYIHSVMSFIRGKNLSDFLCCGDGIAESEVIHLGTRLAIAGCDMHRHDLLFTDLKSDNILINQMGYVKIIDLTCFERIGNKPEISLGTEPYAAPELTQRKKLSEAVDIYSIGMVLYEAAVGTGTFTAPEFKPRISEISGKFPKVSRIISKAIEQNPKKRYQTARELLNELNKLKQGTSKQHEFSFKRSDGKVFIIPPGTHVIGRDEIAPQNIYVSGKQFEIDYDGQQAQMRDIANKSCAYLDNTLMSSSWQQVKNSSQLKIADITLKFNLK